MPEETVEQTVPYDRFKQANEAKKAADDARAEAEEAKRNADAEIARLKREADQRERAGLPEVDRLKSELADLQQQLVDVTADRDQGFQARDAKLVDLERGGWVRAAAAAAGFHDPEDAVIRMDLSKIRTEDGARREVEALSERAKHLTKPKVDPSGSSQLQTVLSNGEPVQPADGGDQFQGEQLTPEGAQLLASIKAAQQGGWIDTADQ